MKKALIAGISGQDGLILAALLIDKGYRVYGFDLPAQINLLTSWHNQHSAVVLYDLDITNVAQVKKIVSDICPDEIYNLAALSSVQASFIDPIKTACVTGLGVVHLLDAIYSVNKMAKFYQASSCEMFGNAPAPQSEKTPLCPRSPYAAAKVYAHWMVINYRESYNMFACSGILFNHESFQRPENFVTRKITKAVASLLSGKQKKLYMGNLDVSRDWGFAPEYVEAMWLMLQQEKADDYVIGTGQTHTVREFIEKAFECAGVSLEWQGSGLSETGIVKHMQEHWRGRLNVGDQIIEIDPLFFRPAEVNCLQADITKAREQLGWQPCISFKELVKMMVDYDLQEVESTTSLDYSKKTGFQLSEFVL